MWVAIVILVVLLLGGGGTTYFLLHGQSSILPGQSSPMVTLQKFCDGWNKSNVQEMYDTFSSSMKAITNLTEMQNSFKMQKDRDCAVSDVQQNGSQATATMTGMYTDSAIDNMWAPVRMRAALMQENGQWKIDAIQNA